ncbi:hypothetical protein Tco_1200845 [Tanacetum coccineum]
MLESRLEPSPNIPVVMKPVQSVSLSMPPAHRYGDPASKCESLSESAYLGYPLSQHRYPGCPAPELQQAWSP